MSKEMTIGRIEQLTTELHPDYTHIYRLAFADGVKVGFKEGYDAKEKEAQGLYEALKFAADQIIAWTDFKPVLTPFTKLAIKTIDEAIAKWEGK